LERGEVQCSEVGGGGGEKGEGKTLSHTISAPNGFPLAPLRVPLLRTPGSDIRSFKIPPQPPLHSRGIGNVTWVGWGSQSWVSERCLLGANSISGEAGTATEEKITLIYHHQR